MVMVFTLPKQLTRKFLQVPFGRLGAFFLKPTTETEETSFLLFPLLAAKKVTSRGDSRTSQTQVYPHNFIVLLNAWFRDGYDDMQTISSLAVAQISTTRLTSQIEERVFGDSKSYLNTTCKSRKTTGACVPFDPVGTGIISNSTQGTLWSLDGFVDGYGFVALL